MKTFQVYRHSGAEPQAVKVGFCWPAFFFGIWWMLISRLWLFALIWLALSSIFGVFGVLGSLGSFEVLGDETSDDPIQMAASLSAPIGSLVMMVIAGAKGNGWRAARLMNEGYTLSATVQAPSAKAAIDSGPQVRSRPQPGLHILR